MGRILTVIATILFGQLLTGQTIYKGFETGMSEKEVKDEYKAHKDEYSEIDTGNGFFYRTYRNHMIYSDGGLVGIKFMPKGSAMGLGYDNTVLYLDHTKDFLTSLGYEVFFEPEFWNAPLNFSSKYGLIMTNQDKTTVAHLYPIVMDTGAGKSYNMALAIFNYDQYMEWYNEAKEKKQETAENSGF